MTVDEGRTVLMNENYKSLVYEMTTIDAKWIAKKKVKKPFCEVSKSFWGNKSSIYKNHWTIYYHYLNFIWDSEFFRVYVLS